MRPLAVPVHVGTLPPDYWDDIEARQREHREDASPRLQAMRRPALAETDVHWDDLGIEPRWVGVDAATCAAALQPSIFSGQGAEEFRRFRQGVELRGEMAVVISRVGQAGPIDRSPLFVGDGSIYLGGNSDTMVTSRRIGAGARVRAADGLGPADGQLALRLLTCSPAPLWRSLSLEGVVAHSVFGVEEHVPEGVLLPILLTDLGEPAAAVWVSSDQIERHYVVPAETPWPVLLSWLAEQALPEFAPGAMRRSRRKLASHDDLRTLRETGLQSDLEALELEYADRRRAAEDALREATAAADTVRDLLLFGTGHQLVEGVRMVLVSAGIDVVDLDRHLGGTKNADLLCSYDGQTRLVEVKSASGAAPERAYQDLLRHMREWEFLPGQTPVHGGALVMSHELRSFPLDRSSKPFSRPEFLVAQNEPIISAVDLFHAWRREDADAVRALLFSSSTNHAPTAQPDRSTSIGGVAEVAAAPWRRLVGRRRQPGR